MSQIRNIPLPDSRVGVLFPSWMAKFINEFNKKGKRKSNTRFQPLTHQHFLQAFLRNDSPMQSIFLYHGLGTGKTCSVLFTYNSLFNFDKSWNVFILIRKALTKTWRDAMQTCINTKNGAGENIHFINYDGYSTVVEKFETMLRKYQRPGVRDLFVIDEAHNMMSAVVNNIHHAKEKSRTPALRVYRKLQENLLNNKSTRLMVITATPAINEAYELAILFNLLKPSNLFPEDYNHFNDVFVEPKTGGVKQRAKNIFQRRILGLTSFVMPANPNDFAQRVDIPIIRLRMSDYQESIYKQYRKNEQMMKRISGDTNYGEGTFNIYTRQACNFIFPDMNKDFNAYTRRTQGVKRNKQVFARLSDEQLRKIREYDEIVKFDGKKARMRKEARSLLVLAEKTMDEFIHQLRQYWNKLDNSDDRSIMDDVNELFGIHDKMHKKQIESHVTVHKFMENKNNNPRSKRLQSMMDCSRKMSFIVLMLFLSPGISIVYSSFVRGEGLQIFELYLECFGIDQGSLTNVNPKTSKYQPKYLKFSGELKNEQRDKAQDIVNHPKNKFGEHIKILLISPAGSEGISVMCCRHVHLMEPFFHETRSQQVIGRGIRQGSHKRLDLDQRNVRVYRYLSVIADSSQTLDQIIYDKSKKKQTGIDEFFNLIRESAVDCEMFSELNMKHPSILPYRCFEFSDENLLRSDLGYAYRRNLEKDILLENKGYNSSNSKIESIDVKKIRGKFIQNGQTMLQDPVECLLDDQSNSVYHLETKRIIGTVKKDKYSMYEMYAPGIWKIFDPIFIYT